MELDFEALHDRLGQEPTLHSRVTLRLGLAHRALHRLHLYTRFAEAGLLRGWFIEFNDYWTRALGGRPLKFYDFFYLHSHYRCRFQEIEVAEGASAAEFLQAWQHPANIYLAFGAAYKYAMLPFFHQRFVKYLPRDSRVLEYGCGVAPVITSLIQSGASRHRFVAADIRGITFHFTKWRLRHRGVHCADLSPGEDEDLQGPFEAIFLMTVMEHLPRPVEVTRKLLAALKPGGHLIFDYILGEGTGLDTAEAVAARQEVLELISDACTVIEGELRLDASMGITVVRKR
jgi:2-polyprenyl-3-methyl-5-hydroxy-6-metoxy-1,4-benzoquinol methylase